MSDNELYLQHIQNYIDGKTFSSRYGHCDIKECIFVFRPELRPKPKLLFSEVWKSYQNAQNTFQNNEKQEYLPEENITFILEHSHIKPKLLIDDIFVSLQEGLWFYQKNKKENPINKIPLLYKFPNQNLQNKTKQNVLEGG